MSASKKIRLTKKVKELFAVPKPTRKLKLKKRLPRIRKTPLAKLKRIADKLAGEACRARGKCEVRGERIRCGGPLQWCHIIRRRYQSIKWLPQNCICMCRNHHALFTYNNDDWIAWLMINLQDTYLWLYKEKNKYVKIDRAFLEETIKNLQQYEFQ